MYVHVMVISPFVRCALQVLVVVVCNGDLKEASELGVMNGRLLYGVVTFCNAMKFPSTCTCMYMYA